MSPSHLLRPDENDAGVSVYREANGFFTISDAFTGQQVELSPDLAEMVAKIIRKASALAEAA